jgi:hypothetical protein
MLRFMRGSDLMHSERLDSVDPLTLETYRELLRNNRSLIFSVLICRHSRNIYLAKNIFNIRYGTEHKMCIYMMKDPITRNEVDDVLFYEVKDNPLFRGSIHHSTDEDMPSPEESEIDVVAEFIGTEVDMLFSLELKEKILRQLEGTTSNATIFFISCVILLVLFALIYTFLLILSFALALLCKR